MLCSTLTVILVQKIHYYGENIVYINQRIWEYKAKGRELETVYRLKNFYHLPNDKRNKEIRQQK